MAKRKKAKKIQVSSIAANLKKKLQSDLNVKRAAKDYDNVSVKKNTHRKLKPKSRAKKPTSLDKVRKEFQEYQQLAMARVKVLKEQKLLNKSFAYQKAVETKPKTEKGRRWLFDVNDTKSYKGIQREINRIREFLNDDTSTPEGVVWSLRELELAKKYKGAFGNQWKAQTGGTFDPDRIDEEYIRTAGKVYRMVESVKGAYGLLYDEGSYDSETTFAAIYDMVVRRNITLDDIGNPVDHRAQDAFDQTLMDTLAMLQEYKEKWSEEARREREMGNMDSKSLQLVQEQTTAKDFLSALFKM